MSGRDGLWDGRIKADQLCFESESEGSVRGAIGWLFSPAVDVSEDTRWSSVTLLNGRGCMWTGEPTPRFDVVL